EYPNGAGRKNPGGQMPACRSRVRGINVPVGEPVECHRRAAREDHAQENAHEVQPAKRLLLPRQHRAEQGERQCKYRVAEANHLEDGSHAVEHGVTILRAYPCRNSSKLFSSAAICPRSSSTCSRCCCTTSAGAFAVKLGFSSLAWVACKCFFFSPSCFSSRF